MAIRFQAVRKECVSFRLYDFFHYVLKPNSSKIKQELH